MRKFGGKSLLAILPSFARLPESSGRTDGEAGLRSSHPTFPLLQPARWPYYSHGWRGIFYYRIQNLINGGNDAMTRQSFYPFRSERAKARLQRALLIPGGRE
jgi:hypothetical protein